MSDATNTIDITTMDITKVSRTEIGRRGFLAGLGTGALILAVGLPEPARAQGNKYGGDAMPGGAVDWSCPRLTGHLDGLLGADELAWRAHPEP